MDNPKLKQQVDSRRTFAIISHPDAGKTTITEQLLLFGGAIRQAGTVKGKRLGISQSPTGWKLKNNGGSPLPVPLCSLITKANGSIF